MSIADKAKFKSENDKLNPDDLRREDIAIFGTSKPTSFVEEGFLPASFRPRKR